MRENGVGTGGDPRAQVPALVESTPQCSAAVGAARQDVRTDLSRGRAGRRGRARMFDSSQYPYNCFNYDADGYPAGSADEEKRLTRPAYR